MKKLTLVLALLLPLIYAIPSASARDKNNQNKFVSKDKKFQMLIPPGWNTTNLNSNHIDLALVIADDKSSMTAMVSHQPGTIEDTLKQISEALPPKSKVSQSGFSTAFGTQGVKLTVSQPIEKTNGYSVFQYYYLFQTSKDCYALICTASEAQSGELPAKMFNAIAQTIEIKN